MTHPSDPGHPPHSQGPGPGQPGAGHPGAPYGPPPNQPPGPPQQGPPQGQGQGPASRPYAPGPYGPQDQAQGWTPPPRDPSSKGVFGALFDMNFDHMVTAKLVKIVYALSLVPITVLSLLMAGYGLDWLDQGSTFGLLLLVSSPFVWLFQVLTVRTILEFVINQFKMSEYLRAIKDKD
ncbi:DUF4282 domain-containing protein [Actinomadura sp. 3N508]|uniref:DUF4282 domain-containing protein n=1 Tax=Actinomadura sp. 3N508 TaxID=3375153 RepID=UPI0037918624